MTLISHNLRKFVTVRDALDNNTWIFVRYRIEAAENTSVLEAAIKTALVASLGTVKPLDDETIQEREKAGPRVIFPDREELLGTGYVTIAYPQSLFSGSEGITQLMALMTFGSEFRYTKSIRIESVELPEIVTKHLDGPKHGSSYLQKKLGSSQRPIIGLIIKPRFGVSINKIAKIVYDALTNGIDFVVDDELITDPPGELNFLHRVPILAEVAKKAMDVTGETKAYVANISANPKKMFEYAKSAEKAGAAALLMNSFTTGFGALQDLSSELSDILPIITCNIGISIVSRNPKSDGISNAVFAKLSRLSGADGVHVGSSASDWHAPDAWGPSVLALNTRLYDLKNSLPVAAGGVRLSNVFQNIQSLGVNAALESGSGILGYSGGIKSAAKYFRKLIELSLEYSDLESYKESVLKLGRKDKVFEQTMINDNFLRGTS